MYPGFLTALSFLTRLWPPRIATGEDFARSLPWFPLVGLTAGLAAAAPAWLGLFDGRPELQGWLMVGISLWLTRGLHADGLADVADAWGSNAKGERFWVIMKDSRIGPFGVLGLLMALLGQALAFGALAGEGRLGAVVWCFVLGRGLGVAALCVCRERVRPGLSALFAPCATARTLGLALAQTVLLGLVLAGLRGLVLGLAASCAALFVLARLSRRQMGFNGDFIGACIVLGELAGALGCLVWCRVREIRMHRTPS